MSRTRAAAVVAPWGIVRLRGALLVVLAAVVLALTAAAPARADFGIVEFTTEASSYEAGAHADVTTTFRFSDRGLVGGDLEADGHVRRLEIDLPQGLVGNPTNFPRCSRERFANDTCPSASQVGVADIDLAGFPPGITGIPVFSLEPSRNEPALLALKVSTLLSANIRIRVRPDGGLTAVVDDLPFGSALLRNRITLWGVPADHNGSGADRVPFMANPTKCGEVPVTTLRAWSYEDPDTTHVERSTNTAGFNCDTLMFQPDMTATPTSAAAGGPTGLDVQIEVPQSNLPDMRATAHVRGVRVVLPGGMTVSPSSANGLASCASAEFGYRSDSVVRCPDASKIGAVSIVTPLLEQPMSGSVYLAKQHENPFGSLLALYIVAEGAGVQIKLAGRVDPDPITGRLTATFDDNPQLPFSRLDLSLKGGSRAPLVNPQTCGTYESETTITSWAGHEVSARTPMVIDQDCAPVGFDPSFEAGTISPVGGGSSTFSLTFGRGEHDHELRDITVRMPEGLTGVIASAAVCPAALADAGACGEDSRIGSVTTAAGPGSTPYWLPGRVYLTEGYNGGAYGLSIVVPAVAGPFDLGTVVVRAGIRVDQRTAALTVVSDAMPRILQGIVLHLRTVNVAIDKPGFMLNPTSCRAKQVDGVIGSYGGGEVTRSSRFQVGDCGRLAVRPSMSLQVGDRRHTRKSSTVPFVATLRVPEGNGNLRQVAVKLPSYLASRTAVVNVRVSCSPEQYEAEQCPMQVGTATAVTPLLREPLEGKAFLVRNPERRLPDLMVKLKGQGDARGIEIDLTGRIVIGRDLRLQNVFDTVPDVPVTSFQLRLVSGRNAPLAINRPLCAAATRRQRAQLVFRGHNGRVLQRQQRLSIRGCASRRSAGRGGRAAGGR